MSTNAQTPEAIAGAIAPDMPPPTAAAPTPSAPAETTNAAGVTPPPAADAPRDSLGRAFDPEKFAADSTGRPKVDSKGRFYSNKLGAKKGAAASSSSTPPPPSAPQSFIPTDPAPGSTAAPPPAAAPASSSSAPAAANIDRFAMLGDVYTRAALAGAMAVFGDEWEPDDASEYAALRDSVAAYLRATNRDDLPPGYALAFAALTYAGKRVPRPKTQTRIAGFVAGVKAWWRGHSVARRMAAMPSQAE